MEFPFLERAWEKVFDVLKTTKKMESHYQKRKFPFLELPYMEGTWEKYFFLCPKNLKNSEKIPKIIRKIL